MKIHIRTFFTSLFSFAFALSVNANTMTWTNTAGGVWSDASSWSPNIAPADGDTALLTVSGNYTVTLDSDVNVASLTLGGTSGTQTLDIPASNFAVTGSGAIKTNGVLSMEGGSVDGPGVLTVNGKINWNGGYFAGASITSIATNGLMVVAGTGDNDITGILTNAGIVRLTAGTFRPLIFSTEGGGVGLVVNAPTGLIDIQGDLGFETYADSGATNIPVLINEGTVRKSAGTNAAIIHLLLNNNGTVDAQSGTVSVDGTGSGSGVFKAEPGATISFDTDYEVDGAMTGAGTNLVNAGAMTLKGVISGQCVWAGGYFSGNSAGLVATNGLLVVNGGDAFMDFAGALTNAGTIQMVSGTLRFLIYSTETTGPGQLVNSPSGLIDIQDDLNLETYADPGSTNTPTCINQGTIRKSGGTNLSNINLLFTNTGKLEVQTGTVGINGGGSGNGVFLADAGTTLAFSSDYEVDSDLSGAGTNVFSNGHILLNGNLTTSNSVLTSDALLGGSGVIKGQMIWIAGGTIAGDSTLTVATNGLLVVAGIGYYNDIAGSLTNAGTIQWTSGTLRCLIYSREITGPGQLVNLPGALIDLQDDLILDTYADAGSLTAPALINQGTFRKSGGTNTATFNLLFDNQGTLDIQSGGIVMNGNYDLTGGTLNFGISSLTNFGQINFAGGATLTGTVSANLNNGYQPIMGNSFPVIIFPSQTGFFTNTILPFADAWQTNYDAGDFSLLVLNARPTLQANTNHTVDELTQLSVTNHATDPDLPPQTLTFSLLSPLTGMNVGAASGIFTWTPQQIQSPGTDTVTVVVTDNGTPPLSETNSFSVVVKEVNVPPSLPTISTQTVNELTLLTVVNTATNFNIHSTNSGYTLVNPPSGMIISPTGVITWTPQQTNSPSTNVITTIVTNGNPYDLIRPQLTSTNTFTVVVKEVNVPASLPTISTQTVNELTLLTVNNTATNFNIHSTNSGYALVNPLAGMHIDSSGVFTWTPSQLESPGTNVITTIVTNGNPYDTVNPVLTTTNTFTVIVKEVNVPPSLPTVATQIVNELTLLTVPNTATNANIHSTNSGYLLVNPPSGMHIDSSGVITWTPSQLESPGTNVITTIVTNGNPYDLVNPQLTATNSFTVIVKEVNVPPSLPTISTQTVNELTLLTVPNTATNANIHSTNFGYGLVNPPQGMMISASGVITWTPPQTLSPSTNVITTIVTNYNPYDLVNPQLTATNSFSVVVKEVNVAPSLPVISTRTVNKLTLLVVNDAATNANVHSANTGYGIVNPLTGMTISPSGVFGWTPSAAQSPSTNTVTVIVTNMNPYDTVNPQLTATNSFQVIVYTVTLAPISDQAVNPGQIVSLTASATDNDNTRTLFFTLGTSPAGAVINPVTGLFTWRATAISAGTTTNVLVIASDNSTPAVTDTNSFAIHINALSSSVDLTALSYTNGQFKALVTGPTGPDYVLMGTTNFPSWTDVQTNVMPTPPFQFTDPSTNRYKSYRVRLSP